MDKFAEVLHYDPEKVLLLQTGYPKYDREVTVVIGVFHSI